MRKLLFLAAIALVGCGSSSSTSDAGGGTTGAMMLTPNLSSLQPGVFKTGCAVSSCHDSQSHQANLVLTDPQETIANLVNVPAYEIAPKTFSDGGWIPSSPGAMTYFENICDAFTDGGVPMRVAPGDPDHSYLIWKLEGHDANGASIEISTECKRMPNVAGDTLPQTTIDVIRQWIANGAQNN